LPVIELHGLDAEPAW